MKYRLICEDCKTESIYEAKTSRRLQDKARDDGWAINHDNTRQWCPNCAPKHRNTGKRGNPEPDSKGAKG